MMTAIIVIHDYDDVCNHWFHDYFSARGSPMKVSRERSQQNKEKVIDTAAALVRERGIDGIGIADLMEAVGLTHGGFYRQFKSKDDLILQAVQRAFDSSHELVVQQMANHPNGPFEGLVRYYVSNAHRDATGAGCIVAALASDVARHNSPELSKLVENTVITYIENLIAALPGEDKSAKRRMAWSVLSEMIGAVILSRVINPTLGNELTKTVVADLLERRDQSTLAHRTGVRASHRKN
jgi:TetR/AcrR family transcriptional regulator, transcriptional repressor for nem operon